MPFITSLIFGALSASFALVMEIFILINVFSIEVFFLSGAAVIEELSKYVFLKQYAKRYSSVIPYSAKQAVALGISFGLGFSIIELSLMSYKYQLSTIPPWAMLGSAVLHIITSVIFAVFLFFRPRRICLWQTFSQKSFSNLSAVALAIFLHILYNAFVFSELFPGVLV